MVLWDFDIEVATNRAQNFPKEADFKYIIL